jgi:hypothetical protein
VKVPRQTCKLVPKSFQAFETSQECNTIRKQDCKSVSS